LAHVLASENNLEKFSEPHLRPESMQALDDKVKNKENNFIVKFMPDHVNKYQTYQSIYTSDCYKIKLQRRDKIAQIASFYVSHVSGIWNDPSPIARGEKYFVPVDEQAIDHAVSKILDNDRLLDEMNIKFDQELYYEDLNLQEAHISKLQGPLNYNGICLYLKNKLKNS
jgi:hypothetical protein